MAYAVKTMVIGGEKTFDLLVLIALAGFATMASIVFQASFIVSTILYLLLPSLYLAYRLKKRKQWLRISSMAVIFGGLYGFMFAYLAERNLAWSWPAESFFGEPYYLFDVVNPAAILWVFLWVTYIVLFYEYFFERDNQDKLTWRAWYALGSGLVVLALIGAAELWFPRLIEWTYAYAVLAILAFLPCAFLIITRPRLLPKLLLPALFFIPLHMVHEIVGLVLDQWRFPGNYLATITIIGDRFVPIEEFIIWILIGSVIVVSYYELYIDDRK